MEKDDAVRDALNPAPSEKVTLDLPRRTVYVCGDVDRDMARGLAMALNLLEGTKGEVRLHVNSEGGEEAAGWAMFDLLAASRLRTVFEGYGTVNSIMVAVMQAATVRRLAPNCQVMIHNGTTDLKKGANFDEAEKTVREAARNNARYYRALAGRSSLGYEAVMGACGRETFFAAAEAVRVGLADELISPAKAKKTQNGKGRQGR